MLYLSGAIVPELADEPGLGFMRTPAMGNRNMPAGSTWAADNGCFAHPERFDLYRYLAWVEREVSLHPHCLFATAPDVVGDAEETLQRSVPVLDAIREYVPVALVAQPGMEHMALPWDAFDVLFIGGDDAWKDSITGGLLCVERAKWHGKRAHVGRVNTLGRFRRAWEARADSVDGTLLAYGWHRYLPRIRRMHEQAAAAEPWRAVEAHSRATWFTPRRAAELAARDAAVTDVIRTRYAEPTLAIGAAGFGEQLALYPSPAEQLPLRLAEAA